MVKFGWRSVQLLVAKTACMVLANVVLKHRAAVLVKVQDSVSFKSFMDLWSAELSGSAELFPEDALEKAVEKLSWIFHDEAIHKAVSADEPHQKLAKKLHFLQSSCQQQQQPKLPSGLSSDKSSFSSSTSSSLSAFKISFSSARRSKGKKFLRFLASLTAAGGSCTLAALACLAVLQHRRVESRGAPLGLQDSIPPSPTCVAGAPGASVLFPLVGSRAYSSEGGQEEAPEGHAGNC